MKQEITERMATTGPEYKEKQQQKEMIADMLMAGISPDDIKKLTG